MNSFELAVRSKNLPTKIDDLVPLSFIGASAVKFYKEKIKLCDSLKMTEEQRSRTLKDGQDAGICLLEIQKRIAEISETIPKEYANHGVNKYNKSKYGTAELPIKRAGRQKYEKIGLKNKKQLEVANAIKNNPKIVNEAIEEAIKNEDIPTVSQVMTKIKLKKYMEKHPPVKSEKPDINQIALYVVTKLDECGAKLSEIVKFKDSLNKFNRDGILELIMV